jgi:Flp pilus assembly protein TadD
LANFVAYLKKHGWYENSLVIVTGDHGEGLGEHREETHGIFLYDSTTHVPLIVKLPGAVDRGKTVVPQVRTTDILPTVVDLVHVATSAKFDGESLKPYFAGSDTTPRTAIGETDYPLRFGWSPLRSVRADGEKFIDAPRPELYDVNRDPKEITNTYKADDAAVQKFRTILADAGGTRPAETANLPDPKDKIDEQNLLHTAMLASDDNRDADARSALEKVLELDPKSPTALRQLGELEFNSGDYAKAADHLKHAREVRPDDATAAWYEGQAREKIGDLAGARDALEASLKEMPSQLPARLLLGNVYLGLKQAKAAEDQFEAATLVDPNNVQAQVGVAKAQIAEAQFKEAVAQLEPLSKSQPQNKEVFELLAQAYKGLGQSTEAEKAAQKAASLANP